MSEWLTTGQMIEQLKDGEIAEPQDQPHGRVKRVKFVGLCFVDKNGEVDEKLGHGGRVVVGELFIGQKWRILPKYVSFDEAMKAVKDGYTVQYHNGVPTEKKITPFEAGHHRVGITSISECSLLRLYEGKWTIEGDS